MIALGQSFYAQDAVLVAQALIGCTFHVHSTAGVIVETEAYRTDDPASHSYNGPTPRTRTMFGPPGHLYVYRSYGLHWCANIVCTPGSAVLIRALEPIAGLDIMSVRRNTGDATKLCSGPGKLAQALGMTGDMDGAPLTGEPLFISPRMAPVVTMAGPRIGISKATDQPWRFGMMQSRFLSRTFPRHR